MKRIGRMIAVLIVAGSWPVASMHIVCTTTIVGDVVSRIAGSEDELRVLLPIDADPHAFEPTPRDLVAIAQADVVFLNGAGLEDGLDPILESASGPVVALSDGLDLRSPNGPGSTEDAQHANADPHVWFDPMYVAAWVDRIAAALVNLDPDREPEVGARARAYLSELLALDEWIQEQVAVLTEDRRTLVTDHDVLGYFAARYGFELVGTVFPGLSSLSEPSARELAALEEAIVALSVPALFVGTTVNRSLAEQIAADTGTTIVALYTGSLSGPDGPAATYLDLMRYDVIAIVRGLSGTP